MFRDGYGEEREARLIENIPPHQLDNYLAELYISIRTANGKEYEPISLEGLKNSIERHLKDKQYQISLRDRVFVRSNQALAAKKCQLKKQGLGNKSKASEAVTADDEDKMLKSGALGKSSPESLQFSMFYFFGKMFGLRGRDEHMKLKFGDVVLKADSKGDNKTLNGSKKS